MIHHAAPDFWSAYHPPLHFKRLGDHWSVRVGIHHRALGFEVADGILWFWIGSHAEYDRMTR